MICCFWFVAANSINSSFHQCFAGLSNNVVTLLVEYKNERKCHFSAGFNFYRGIPEKPGIIMGFFFSSPNKLFCEGQKRQAMKRKVTLDIKKAVSSKKATVEDLKGKINQFELASF